MRKNIIGIAFATLLVAVGLLATTAFVGANNNSNGTQILVFESAFLSSSPTGPVTNLDIRTVRISESALFREGGAGSPIGNLTATLIKTKPAGTLGFMVNAANDFLGLGTLYSTRVEPNSLGSLGRVHAIISGSGAFQGARGQCIVTDSATLTFLWTCNLGITAPALAQVGGPTIFLSTGKSASGHAVLVVSAVGAFLVLLISGWYARRKLGN